MKNRKAFVVLLSVLLMLSQMSLGVFADTAADAQDQTTVEQTAETEAPAKAEEETVTSSVADTVQTGATETVGTAEAATEGSTSEETAEEEIIEAQQDAVSTPAAMADTDSEPTIVDGWTYDGEEHDLAVAGSSSEHNYYYATSDSATTEPSGRNAWNKDVPTATDAGTYYVWYRLGMNGDKTYLDSVTVAKATPSVSMESWTYGDDENSPEITSEYDKLRGRKKVTYKYRGTTYAGERYDGMQKPTEAGEYAVYATCTYEDDNWNALDAEASFKIAKASVEAELQIKSSWAFDEVAQAPRTRLTPEIDTDITYEYAKYDSDEEGASGDYAEYVWGEAELYKAGTYILKATVEETANYEGAIAYANFTVTGCEEHEYIVSLDDEDTSVGVFECVNGDFETVDLSLEVPEDVTYDGSKYYAEINGSEDLPDGFTIKFKYYRNGSTSVYSTTAAKKAGAYNVVATVYDSEGDAIESSLSADFEITGAELEIIANDQSFVYGSDEEFDGSDYEISGWIETDGDEPEVELEIVDYNENVIDPEGDDYIQVGTYEIRPKFDDSELENYDWASYSGTLEVTPKTLTIKAQDETIKYGKSAPKFTAVYDGFVGDDDESSIGGLHKFETSYSKGDDAGEYYIYPVEPSFKSDNYEFVFESATLTVEPADITVTWDYTDAFTYDGTEHTVTPSLEFNSGVILSDYLNLDVEASEEYSATDAGSYTAKAVLTGSAADNYTITDATETLEWDINPAELTITWPTQIKYVYTGKEQTVTATIEGIVDGEEDGITATYSGNTGKNVGTYTATLDSLTFDDTTAKESNYSYTPPESFTWYITPASLTITANDQTIYYGEDFDSEDVSYNGFVNGETESTALSTQPTVSSEYYVYAKPGTYELTADGAEALYDNYDITYVNGTLTVKDKVTTIVAKAKASGKTAVKLSWNKVTGANKYVVYMSRCNHNGKTITMKKIKTVTGTSFTVKKLNGSKLLKNTCYKFYVVAYNGSTKISSSKVGHVITGNVRGSYTNAKSIKAANSSVTVMVGGTHKVTATQKKVKSGKKLLDSGHASLVRFRSGNTKVATINENGVITGVSKGWCRVYVQSVDGVWTSVEVNVVE